MDDNLSRAILNVVMWRGDNLKRCQAFLLKAALIQGATCGAEIPAELLLKDDGTHSKHFSGVAVKTLVQVGLLEITGVIPSPNKNAHSRRVYSLRIGEGKHGAVRSWLQKMGYTDSQEIQTELLHTA